MLILSRSLIGLLMLVGMSSAPAIAGDAKAGERKSGACVACHGPNGNAANPSFPSLAGQVPGYIADQLARFKSGERNSPIMAGVVSQLSDKSMADLDSYYAEQVTNLGSITAGEQELALQGEKIYRGGYAPMRISACMSCHGPSGHGVPRRYPRVAGQGREYLEQQLLVFKAGTRPSYGDIMTNISFALSVPQIKALAAYMHALN